MRIAVADRVSRIEAHGSDQAIARVVHTRVDGSGRRPQPVTERAGEARVTLAILRSDLFQRRLVEECAHVTTEARMTPPERVKDRPRVDDALARLITRRQRPGSDDGVRLREIFQQEMKVSVDELRVVAAGKWAAGHQRRGVPIERHLTFAD